MKILIVRHGDPDYINDSLTELGKKEAIALSERMKNVKADECYVSPLGRAKETASYSLEKMNMKATELEWLREFAPKVERPEKTGVAWDWVPSDWTNMPYAFDFDKWTEYPAFEAAGVRKEVDWIYSEFDSFLEKHGYKKDGKIFRAVHPNNETIVLFCHFGLECILLSYLLNLSPFVLWHASIAPPTSITTVVTEERREGIAQFRMLSFGDTSHLYAAGMEPAFSGRFRECFTNENERMD
ncbi:MAG: histidine phosphatase family protein [Lachnospiraceae bacterium]|nr:histidine phosphatase family protein [Lachnospiraceae bacterium]